MLQVKGLLNNLQSLFTKKPNLLGAQTFGGGDEERGLYSLLADGNTVAWYRPGIGVTGTLTASAWANQMGAAGSLEQATAGAQPIYLPFAGEKFVWTAGVASNDITSPNQVITGNFTLTMDVAPDDWTPASLYIFDKASGSDGIQVVLLATGVIRLRIGDGVSLTSVDSSVGQTLTDATRHTLTIVWTDGVGATFLIDGVALGTAVAAAKTLTNAAVVATAVGNSPGKYYRTTLTNGAGTTYYDMNAADSVETSTNGATWVSANGETWTLNNTAIATPAAIVGSSFVVANESNRWMRAPYTANQPRTIYLVGMDPVWAAGKYIADGVTANTLGLSKTTATPKISLNAGAAAAEDANLALRTKGIVTIVLNGASSSIQVNSNAATTGNAGAGNPGGLTIGADGGTPTAGSFGGFWYSEIIDRDGADSAATQAKIRRRLRQIHGTS